jgi:hypothetical protein
VLVAGKLGDVAPDVLRRSTPDYTIQDCVTNR